MKNNPGLHKYNLLIIDDEKRFCESLKHLLSSQGFNVYTAHQAKAGLQIVQRQDIDLIICDIVMPDMSGLVLIDKIKRNVPVVMITAYASIETSRRAFKLGARDYLVKPFDFDELLVVIQQNLNKQEVPISKPSFERCFETNNPSFREMLDLAAKFGKTEMPILITGESGTGKEVLAKYLHEHSERKDKPLVSLNCAAIPETLLESELFGFEKGAFTGAVTKKAGKFKEAEQGTLFLDEIADMPMYLQAKILRFLQEFTFYPLGSDKSVYVDTRIIAATNKNLPDAIKEGTFREDLFHRLNGLHLEIPPLRERKDDLGILVDFFLKRFTAKYKKNIDFINDETQEIIRNYNWPGNIRELRNCIERAVVVCEENVLMPEHLADSVRSSGPGSGMQNRNERTYTNYKDDYMRKVIIDALDRAKGHRSEAARLLHISRKTLYNRMKDLNIKYVFE